MLHNIVIVLVVVVIVEGLSSLSDLSDLELPGFFFHDLVHTVGPSYELETLSYCTYPRLQDHVVPYSAASHST